MVFPYNNTSRVFSMQSAPTRRMVWFFSEFFPQSNHNHTLVFVWNLVLFCSLSPVLTDTFFKKENFFFAFSWSFHINTRAFKIANVSNMKHLCGCGIKILAVTKHCSLKVFPLAIVNRKPFLRKHFSLPANKNSWFYYFFIHLFFHAFFLFPQ